MHSIIHSRRVKENPLNRGIMCFLFWGETMFGGRCMMYLVTIMCPPDAAVERAPGVGVVPVAAGRGGGGGQRARRRGRPRRLAALRGTGPGAHRALRAAAAQGTLFIYAHNSTYRNLICIIDKYVFIYTRTIVYKHETYPEFLRHPSHCMGLLLLTVWRHAHVIGYTSTHCYIRSRWLDAPA